jgi:hypothetical protein
MSKVLRPGGSKCTQVDLTLGAFPYSIFQPNVISIAEDVNIIGQSLKGRKLILKPVNNDTPANTTRHADEARYTAAEVMFFGSIAVTIATKAPTNISAIPSVIHSIAIIFRLSALISPKSRMTDFVGKRCETPQRNGRAAPTYIKISPFILSGTYRKFRWKIFHLLR